MIADRIPLSLEFCPDLVLAIARELVEARRGWIRLGEEGPDSLGGATFHVWIPTRASESLEEAS